MDFKFQDSKIQLDSWNYEILKFWNLLIIRQTIFL